MKFLQIFYRMMQLCTFYFVFHLNDFLSFLYGFCGSVTLQNLYYMYIFLLCIFYFKFDLNQFLIHWWIWGLGLPFSLTHDSINLEITHSKPWSLLFINIEPQDCQSLIWNSDSIYTTKGIYWHFYWIFITQSDCAPPIFYLM